MDVEIEKEDAKTDRIGQEYARDVSEFISKNMHICQNSEEK